MVNPIIKAWKHAMAKLDVEVEQNADPKVQIEQAISAAKRQHQALSQQAATIIGNQHQLEMKLSRQCEAIEKTRENVRHALLLADESEARGESARAREYEAAATQFSAQLVEEEQGLEDLKGLYSEAVRASAQAKDAVERNAHALKAQLAERTKLLNQLEQTIMQEKVAAAVEHFNAPQESDDVPSLEQIRERIEARYARAVGVTELAGGQVNSRMTEIAARTENMPTARKLAEIRAEMTARGELSQSSDSARRELRP